MITSPKTVATLLTIYLLMAFFLPSFYPESEMGGVFDNMEETRLKPEESTYEGIPVVGQINGFKDFIVQSMKIMTTIAGLPVYIMVLEMPIFAKIPLLAISILTYIVVISNTIPIIKGLGSVLPTT